MNTSPRIICAAWLLLTVMPMVAAQDTAKKAPPAAPPAAGQSQDEPSESSKARAARLKRDLDQKVEAIRTYSAERRVEAMANAKRAAEDLDRQMQTLQQQMDQRWGRMSEAARARGQATMADLRKRRYVLAEWMGGLRHGSTAAWDEVRSGFVKSYHELADALRRARADFEKEKKDHAAEKAAKDDKPRDDKP